MNYGNIDGKNTLLNYYTYKYDMFSKFELEYNPTLSSVMTVEKMIFDSSGEFTKYQLWKRLPKKMQYQKFSVVIDYLIYSGKIAIDSNGVIAWTYNPELYKKYFNSKELGR
jgi:hypothetical protein